MNSFIDAYKSDTPTHLIVKVALLEVEEAINNSSRKDKTIPMTCQMRYALEEFITPLGDHTSAITAGEVAKWYCRSGSPNITHGMSLMEETVTFSTNSSLAKLETAIREAVENESEVA